MEIEQAIEVFVRGFCQVKSLTHPYVPRKLGPLWVMEDAPRKRARKTEVIAYGVQPTEVVSHIHSEGLGWHFVCHLHEDESQFDEIRSAYKAIGYKALSTEWLFFHDMKAIPDWQSEPSVQFLETQDDLVRVPQDVKQPRKFVPGWRMFCAFDEEKDYGWVDDIPVDNDAWVSSLYVHREYRGQGIGRALMSQLLLKGRECGVQRSVLLASADGARLYPHVGYQRLGILQLFCPKER
jgi:GNAT superfamily N-acetyltransferase